MSLPFFQRYPVSPLSHQFTLRISPSRDRSLGAGANTSTFSNLGIFNNQTCVSAKFLLIDGWIDSLKHRYHISGVVNPTNVAICEILCFIAAWLTGYSTPSHNTSRPSPPISYALWNLCSTINVTLCDRVTFDDISRNLGGFPINAFCAIDCWLSNLHTQCIQP